jgi:hypothetical protein
MEECHENQNYGRRNDETTHIAHVEESLVVGYKIA